MYFYFNKQGVLKTAITHGEPVRQGSFLNITVCLDKDTALSGVTPDGKTWNLNVNIQFLYPDNTLSAEMPLNSNPNLVEFHKVDDAEITYDLVDGEKYYMFTKTFGSEYSITNIPGNLIATTYIIKTIEETENTSVTIDRQYQGNAKIFVEPTFGIDTVISDTEWYKATGLTKNEYDNLIATLSEMNTAISQKSTVVASGTGDSELEANYLTIDGTEWKIGGDDTLTGVSVNNVLATIENKIAKLQINKSTVGLGNVDNTSDANKPISIATQEALDSTVKITGDQNIAGTKTFTNIVKFINDSGIYLDTYGTTYLKNHELGTRGASNDLTITAHGNNIYLGKSNIGKVYYKKSESLATPAEEEIATKGDIPTITLSEEGQAEQVAKYIKINDVEWKLSGGGGEGTIDLLKELQVESLDDITDEQITQELLNKFKSANALIVNGNLYFLQENNGNSFVAIHFDDDYNANVLYGTIGSFNQEELNYASNEELSAIEEELGNKANLFVVKSHNLTVITDTNNTAVPVLSVEQVSSIYDALIAHKLVFIHNDFLSDINIKVLQQTLIDNKKSIYFEYLSRLLLIYTVNGDRVDITFKEVLSKDYMEQHFAPLTFVSNLYGKLYSGNVVRLLDTAPTASNNNILQLLSSTNTEYNWNNPSVIFERKIEVDTTLSKTNSLTFTLKYKVSRSVTVSWGAKVQYSTNGTNWEDLSSNQSFSAVTIQNINDGISTDITVFMNSIVGIKNIQKDSYLRILLFKKQDGPAELTTNLYFGVNVDNAYVCTFAQFNFTNISIGTEQIANHSVTKEKLSNDLTTEIDGKLNSSNATTAPTSNTVMLRDGSGRSQVENPSNNKDIANKSYVDNVAENKLNKSTDVKNYSQVYTRTSGQNGQSIVQETKALTYENISGGGTVPIRNASNNIQVGTATNNLDATNKSYVDNGLANKQNSTDNTLQTTAKTVVGAINELYNRPDTEGTVTSVNGETPDTSGNVQLDGTKIYVDDTESVKFTIQSALSAAATMANNAKQVADNSVQLTSTQTITGNKTFSDVTKFNGMLGATGSLVLKLPTSTLAGNKTLATTDDIPDTSDFITKNVNDLVNYTKSSDLATVATSGSYNDLSNKPILQTTLENDSNNAATTTAIRAFVNSSISASAANYVTSTASGDNFPDEDALTSATTYYYNGSPYTLKNNDYAIVADSGVAHDNLQARYIYILVGTTGSWNFQYTIGSAFTEAENAALHSGITSTKVDSYDTHVSSTSNPHNVTKSQVGLGNVDNTSDLNKPVSIETQNALNEKQSVLSTTNQLNASYIAQDSTHRFATDAEKSTWNGKQSALNTNQLNAVNSGITSGKVSTYDGYATSKQDTLSTNQLNAVNSGITSSKVSTYDGYATSKQNAITSSSKLSSDLVDDTNQTNQFVTSTEKSTWNGKYSKPSGGIPSTDMSSAVQSSLALADTSLQSGDNISELNNNSGYLTASTGVTSVNGNHGAITNIATSSDISAITAKIPTQASASNQLADKEFVNSSISTNTATFRGTYDIVSDLGLTRTATHTQVATALKSTITTVTNNDYAYVYITDETITTQIIEYDRYKYNSTSATWSWEYTLNNSSFTANQWSAINSGITSTKVSNYDTHISSTSNPHNVTKSQVGLSNVVNTGDSATPVSGGTTKFTTGGAYTELAKKQNTLSTTNKLSPSYIATDSSNRFVTDSDKTAWSGKSTVSVSSTGTSTNEAKYITVNGAEYKMPSEKTILHFLGVNE